MRRYGRSLVWAVAYSLLLHGVLWDLWRAKFAPISAPVRPTPLQWVVREEDAAPMPEPIARALPERPRIASIARHTPVVPVARENVPAPSKVEAPPALPQPVADTGARSLLLRSGNAAEAEIALRLALAQAWGDVAGPLQGAWRLRCHFDVAGRLLLIEDAAGVARPDLLMRARTVLAPEVLRREAWMLEVLWEADLE